MKIIIPGVPVGKGRPKFSAFNGHAVAYTPEKTVNYENLVKLSFQQTGETSFDKDAMLRANIVAYFPIPKSTSKKKRELIELGLIMPTKKPDLDNIAKAILDALNGLAYYDDAQVCQLEIMKCYSDTPRAEVIINTV